MSERQLSSPPISPLLAFSELLRQHRVALGLTQEELAERATLSLRGVSDLERGVKTRPQRETIRLLAEALTLEGAERDHFEAVARGRVSVAPVARATVATATVTTWPDSLPAVSGIFVGREENVRAVSALVCEPSVGLVTITGPGGIGKTRLALEVSAAVAGMFAHGAVFVPLAAVRDPALVPAAVAEALGITAQRDTPVLETVLTALAERTILLVMDNFEQITAAATFVATLRIRCPLVTVLVTSRASLHVRGEREYPLAPLGLPSAETPAAASESAAVTLFVARARQAKADFVLSETNAGAVAAICTLLDGLPLAIELAAARVRLLPPEAMRARLDSRLTLLSGGGESLPVRQRTMRDAIAWSYDLLEAREKRLFRRLGACIGGCTVEAAEALWGDDPDPTANVLGWIDTLEDKSLMRIEERPDNVRLAMLEVIREFAAERLEEAGEGEAVRRLHATYYDSLAERGRREARGADQVRWLARLEEESANFRAALTWAHDTREIETGLHIAGMLFRFWYTHAHYEEGQAWLESLLTLDAQAGFVAHPRTRARALNGAGFFALAASADYARSIHFNEQALALWQEDGNLPREADTLDYLAEAAKSQGNMSRAMELYAESLTKRELAGDDWGKADTLYRVGGLRQMLGDTAGAVADFGKCLHIRRRLHDTAGTAYVLQALGEVVHGQGDEVRAQADLTESLELFQQVGNQSGIASALTTLGFIAENRGDYSRSAARYEEALAIHRTQGNRVGIADVLNKSGILAYRQGDLSLATEHWERALAMNRETGDRSGIAFGLSYLGAIDEAAGNAHRAARAFVESLTLFDALGNLSGVMDDLESLARVAHMQGRATEAARLFCMAATIRDTASLTLSPPDAEVHHRAVETCRATLGAKAFDAAWAAGASLTHDAVVREATALFADSLSDEAEEREQHARQEVHEVRIAVDDAKRAHAVAEITGTEYFQQLQERAVLLRKRGKSG